jgi:hypothetical protein
MRGPSAVGFVDDTVSKAEYHQLAPVNNTHVLSPEIGEHAV